MKRIEYSPISKGVVQTEGSALRKQASGIGNPGQDTLSDRGGREDREDADSLDLEEQLVSALYLVQTKNEVRERAQETSRETQRRSGQEVQGRGGTRGVQEAQGRGGTRGVQEAQDRGGTRSVQEAQGRGGTRGVQEAQSRSRGRSSQETQGRSGARASQEPQRKGGLQGTSRESQGVSRERGGSQIGQDRAREGARQSQRRGQEPFNSREIQRKSQESSSSREPRRKSQDTESAQAARRSRQEAEAARRDRRRLETEWRKEVRPRKRRKKGNPAIVLIILAVFVLLAGGGGWLYVDSLAYKVCRVEAGVEVKPSDFLKKPDENAVFTGDSQNFDITEPGEYKVKVKSGLFTHGCKLIIEDTVAPQAQPVDMRVEKGSSCEAEQFVTDIVDATQVTVSYGLKPDFDTVGDQNVQIILTDKGGNQTTLEAKLTVFPQDSEPPQIIGATDLTIFVGDSVSYKKDVTVEDNNPEGVELSVDSSAVNLKEAGVYPVVYTATDAAGNTTSVTVNLTIKAREHGIDEVNALADQVLARILTPDMTLEQKARAIFDYNKSHIGYINNSDKSDWVKAAYEGLALGKGDCYVYACTAKLLLTRAEIPNMDIAKIPTETLHYWNLVDVGDGWYHFDTTPRVDHPVIYMWTDEKLMEYSKNHKNCHNYDHSAYPKVN